jgi:hypothetical protein
MAADVEERVFSVMPEDIRSVSIELSQEGTKTTDLQNLSLSQPVQKKTRADIHITLNLEKAYQWLKFTEANLGKKITLRVNGVELYKDVVIASVIRSGQLAVMNTDSLEAAINSLSGIFGPKATKK